MAKDVAFCLHGHFYQPPRENPWIEEIEQQDSAAPFHDWNERIHYECYLPNSRARALDSKGKIVEIVNNFERSSFNFGPSLLSWLEAKHPLTYKSILRADEVSRELHRGHGNAIAQIYNHMIMPLANLRDKRTQVQWGIEDFRHRFGREPESIWLSETACNEETLEVLVEAKMKYVILSPYQARAVRPIDGGEWREVMGGHIDPRRPYRYFLKNNPALYIDMFFYDGPISRAIGFDSLLFDAKLFMDRLQSAVIESDEPQLVHIATDGETYGHHKPYGDRVLAYLTYVEVQRRGFRIVNYGEYLEENQPKWEVRLLEGDNGEGTAWSCAHGVARWKDHCGCRGGGPANWTQHWRKPLRWALDWLRDELARVYEKECAKYLKDGWAAREDYISVILDRSEQTIRAFFAKHALRELSRQEVTACLKLLEMQRYLMLMYTSCGWFFSELSGLETVQILQYAARAVELGEDVSGMKFEKDFVEHLALAKSNMELFKDGQGVYEKCVKPAMATLHHIVSYYAICSIFENYYAKSDVVKLYSFNLHILHQRKEFFGTITMNFGRVRVVSQTTLEEQDLVFVVIQIGFYDFRCSVMPFKNEQEFENLERELFDALYQLPILDLSKKIDAHFGEAYFALKDLRLGDRVNVINRLTHETIEKVSNFYENIYEENLRMNEIYRSINVPIPVEFRYAAEHTLSKRMVEAVREWGAQGFVSKRTHSINRIMDSAKALDVRIQKDPIAEYLNASLNQCIKKLVAEPLSKELEKAVSILRLAKKIDVFLDKREAQDELFAFVKSWKGSGEAVPQVVREQENHMVQLMEELELSTERFRKILGSGA
jgi:alpha-amylase/alpha-mannosidase (GH57 family)